MYRAVIFILLALLLASFTRATAQVYLSPDTMARYYDAPGVLFREDVAERNIKIPGASLRYTPSIQDIVRAEELFDSLYNKAIKADSRSGGLGYVPDARRYFFHYGRQYLGYKDSAGNRFVFIHLLNFAVEEEDKNRFYRHFGKGMVWGSGGFFEINMRSVYAALDASTLHIY